MNVEIPVTVISIIGYLAVCLLLAIWFYREWNREYWISSKLFRKAHWSLATRFIIVLWFFVSVFWGAIFWW